VYWVGSVTLCALAGTLIPDSINGLDFAVTALFLVLGMDAYRDRRGLRAPIAAVACALLAHAVAPQQVLLLAMLIITGYLLARYTLNRDRTPRRAADA
jgi:predicted branched-subunit amino acid permease